MKKSCIQMLLERVMGITIQRMRQVQVLGRNMLRRRRRRDKS